MQVTGKTHIIASAFIGMIIVLMVAGFPAEVFNRPKTSTLFGASILCLALGLLFPIFVYCKKIRMKWTDGLIFCFLLYYLLNFKHPNTLSNTGYLFLILAGIVVYCLSKLSYGVIYGACALALLWLSVWGYLQYAGILPANSRYFLLTGPYYNPAIFAAVLALLSGILINVQILYFHLFQKRRFVFIVTLILLALSVLLLVLTHSRAAYLTLATSIVFAGYYRFLRDGWSRKLIMKIVAGIITLLVSIMVLYMLKPHSADGRVLIWKVSCEMIKDKPIAGFGSGGFAGNYMYYQARYMESAALPYEQKLAGSTHLAFNELLLMTVEHGIIGLATYIAFMIWVLFPVRSESKIAVISKSVVAAVVVWGMFAYPKHAFPVMVIMILAIACYLHTCNIRKSALTLGSRQQKTLMVTTVCVALLLGVNLSIKLNAYHGLHSFIRSHKLRELPERIDLFTEFMPVMKYDESFLYLYCKAAKIAQKENEFFQAVQLLEETLPTSELLIMKGDFLQETRKYTEAEAAYRLAAAMEPAKQTARGKLAVLCKEIGREAEAMRLIREILTEEVKVYGFDTYELHNKLKKIFEDEFK